VNLLSMISDTCGLKALSLAGWTAARVSRRRPRRGPPSAASPAVLPAAAAAGGTGGPRLGFGQAPLEGVDALLVGRAAHGAARAVA
jgi:hypothetical protein